MKIRQFTYFVVSSRDLSVEELTDLLGLPADEAVEAGSRSTTPKRPLENSWRLRCDEPGLDVGEQIERLVARLESGRPALRSLTNARTARATLQLVRYFDDEEGEGEEDPRLTVVGLRRLPGQHQLLGWHVDADVVAFLADVGADIDVDEYG